MKKKQISIVMEIDDNENELELISKIKIFLAQIKYVNVTGTHIKAITPRNYGH